MSSIFKRIAMPLLATLLNIVNYADASCAAEIAVPRDKLCKITLGGTIDPGDLEKLERVVPQASERHEKKGIDTVCLNSPGGS